MALGNYSELQISVLNWLARPGDALVAPFVPEMIQLFEAEARRRLKCDQGETRVAANVTANPITLPADCRQLRLVTSGGVPLLYVTPPELPGGTGVPCKFTLHGRQLRFGPAPTGAIIVELLYQAGVPALSDGTPTNWLLLNHPDCYLYGTLANAAAFIGHDERIQLWLTGREAAFASIEQADRKLRWSGSPLQIRPDLYGVARGAWTAADPMITLESDVDIVLTNDAGIVLTSAPTDTWADGTIGDVDGVWVAA